MKVYDPQTYLQQQEQLRTEAAQMTKEIAKNYETDPALFAELVAFQGRFYSYSTRNVELIYAQNPNVSFLASYKRFQELGWNVQRGQHGYKIFVPTPVTLWKNPATGEWKNLSSSTKAEQAMVKQNAVEVQHLLRFKLGTVFDISQTDCPPEQYPRIFSMGQQSDLHAQFYDRLARFCEIELHCPVKIVDMESITVRGQYFPTLHSIEINQRLNDTQRLSTLAHEIGHAILHAHPDARTLPTAQKEIEADTVSVMIAARLGLEIPEPRKDHLADSWQKYAQWRREQQQADSDPAVLPPDGEQIIDRASRCISAFAPQLDQYMKEISFGRVEIVEEIRTEMDMEI